MLNYFALFRVLSLPGVNGIAAEKPAVGIKIPVGNNIKLTVRTKGDQTLKCQAPDAVLYDKDKQNQVGTHGAGPLRAYQNGSSIKGKMIQKIQASEPDAAPWQLLEGKEPDGQGLLTRISLLLRFNTKGGLPPDAQDAIDIMPGEQPG